MAGDRQVRLQYSLASWLVLNWLDMRFSVAAAFWAMSWDFDVTAVHEKLLLDYAVTLLCWVGHAMLESSPKDIWMVDSTWKNAEKTDWKDVAVAAVAVAASVGKGEIRRWLDDDVEDSYEMVLTIKTGKG